MGSFGKYGLDRLSQKMIFGTFAAIGLPPLLAVALKAGGVVSSVGPIIFFFMGVISVVMNLLGIYMFREAVKISRKFVKAKAVVVDNQMAVGGIRLKLNITHNSQSHAASVLLASGHKRRGVTLRVIFDPDQPSTVYLYDMNFFFIPLVPVIIGVLFGVIVINQLF